MSKAIKSEATINITDLIKSSEFKKYHEKVHSSRLVLARMKEILQQKKISQEELANRMDMKQSSISRLLNGNRPNFSVEVFVKFCEAVDVKFVF